MRLDVRTNFTGIDTALNVAQRQVPFALARALTLTGRDVVNAERNEMSSVFDRPTPYTLNAFFLRPATKDSLQAEVGRKDSAGHRHYLPVQIQGGERPLKGFERMLVAQGLMRANERAVPALGAIMDSYGNMSRGQLVKILSQLRAFTAAGFDANATNSKRSRAKRAREAYFVSLGPGKASFGGHSWSKGRMLQHLPRGIWVRLAFGARETAVQPVLLFVPRVTYRARLRFDDVARETVQRVFPRHFDESFAAALRTARPGARA